MDSLENDPGNLTIDAANDTVPQFHLKQTLIGHTNSISSIKFSPDGKWLASACIINSLAADKTIRLWHCEDGRHERCFVGHTAGICDLAWSSNSQSFCTGSDDYTIKIWDIYQSMCTKTLKGHTNHVFCVDYNPDSNLIVSGSFDTSIRVWDVKRGKSLKVLSGHTEPITAVCFNRDGTLIGSSSHDGLIRLWDTATGQCLKTIMEEVHPPISFLRFSPNGKYLLSATLDSTLRLWSYTGKCVKVYQGHVNTKYCSRATFWGNYILCGSENHRIYLWDLQTREIVNRIEGHHGIVDSLDAVLSIDCHPHRIMLASGGIETDCTIKLWFGE